MPVVPGVETPSRRAIRLESLPGLLRIANAPLESVAIPAESYPRYSSRFNPSIRRGAASREPPYPTIPHIGWIMTEAGEEQTGGLGDGATGRKSPSLLPPHPAPPSPRLPVRLFRRRTAQPAMFFWGTRVRARASAGTSFVMVEPAPT